MSELISMGKPLPKLYILSYTSQIHLSFAARCKTWLILTCSPLHTIWNVFRENCQTIRILLSLFMPLLEKSQLQQTRSNSSFCLHAPSAEAVLHLAVYTEVTIFCSQTPTCLKPVDLHFYCRGPAVVKKHYSNMKKISSHNLWAWEI